jgi:hypothetical protein
MKTLLFAIAILLLPGAVAAQEGPRRVAVFDVELWDTSGEGEKPEQTARLAMLTAVLRDRLATRSDYALVNLTPVRPEIEGAPAAVSLRGVPARDRTQGRGRLRAQRDHPQNEHAGAGDRSASRGRRARRNRGVPRGLDPQQQRRCLASGPDPDPRAPAAHARALLRRAGVGRESGHGAKGATGGRPEPEAVRCASGSTPLASRRGLMAPDGARGQHSSRVVAGAPQFGWRQPSKPRFHPRPQRNYDNSSHFGARFRAMVVCCPDHKRGSTCGGAARRRTSWPRSA